MALSVRNRLEGATITEVISDATVAEVALDYKGTKLISVITANAAKALELKVGDTVAALVKATEVMIEK